MATKKEVVISELSENLVSLSALGQKWLVDWNLKLGKILDFLHNVRKDDFIGLINRTHEIVRKKSEKIGKVKIITDTKNLTFIKSGIIIPALAEPFYPQDHFKNGCWTSDDFNKHVLSPVKVVESMSEMSFSQHKLKRITEDKMIMAECGISLMMTREEILRTIAYLTSQQPNGEQGDLQTNGNATIIGYMMCEDGLVRAVRVRWVVGHRDWGCICRYLDKWFEGCVVLSRN